MNARLCGFVNSFVVDFILRKKIAANINMFQVYELPIPKIKIDNKYFVELIKNVAKVICVNSDFDELAKKVNVTGVKNSEEKIEVVAKINAIIAKIYELTIEELKFIIESFPQEDKSMKENTIREFQKLN